MPDTSRSVSWFRRVFGGNAAPDGSVPTRLRPCHNPRNCATETLSYAGLDATSARRILREVFECWPRARLVTWRDGYGHATCRIRLLPFVDDVEVLFDDVAGVIEVRSASRFGRFDFGVNGLRIARLRRDYEAAARQAASPLRQGGYDSSPQAP